MHLFKKTANSVTYISPLRIRTHVEELLYRRKIWSGESKGKRLKTLASNLPTIPYCFYRWVTSKYTLVNLLALEKNCFVIQGVCWVWTCRVATVLQVLSLVTNWSPNTLINSTNRNLEFCKADRTTWKLTSQDINRTQKEAKTGCNRFGFFLCPVDALQS